MNALVLERSLKLRNYLYFFLLEIVKVRSVLFQNNDRAAMALPEAEGPTIIKTHKVWVPIKENPEVSNFKQ